MRCYLGKKKVDRLARETGLPIVDASVRGNEEHSVKVLLEDKTTCYVYPDGDIYKDEEDGTLTLIRNYKK